MRRIPKLLTALTLSSALVGCSAEGPADDIGNNPPLASLDEIEAGAPPKSDIPRIPLKGDGNLPSKSTELRDTQSPVQSQGRRGVCSIFSTVALMEHLYIAEGFITEPDFSEQYLQWSAKFEVFSFPNSSGSNAGVNLQAISRFGIPEESAWPYEIEQWGEDDDAECDGEDEQPTRCYTNGAPPQEALDAEKFHLPSSRWLHPLDIKNHIHSEKTGVVVGLTFFYQSWNHRKSELPTNSDYWDEGYVLYPNADDEEISTQEDKRAGHSILLIGWDDDLEIQKVDKDGNKVVDANGEPVVEKGFYIFKN
ncbi:MAG: C1 family peptidase, partial [Deltaproteobacteria bacterium]|nr:C1 family peptidase [Deltaproteobacteria bacterium]